MASPLTNLTCRVGFTTGLPRSRADDLACLYESSNWDISSLIISHYNIRYVVVGTLERRSYHVNEALFQQHLLQVFQQGQLVIYGIP